MDHSIAALTPVTLAEIARETFEAVTREHSRLMRALSWETLVTLGIQRAWTVNLGKREAPARIAHLFCEVFARLHELGPTDVTTCAFPLTQTDLRDATGMTPVHVNRALQELKACELGELKSEILTIPNLAALHKVALFEPNYLRVARAGAEFDADDI